MSTNNMAKLVVVAFLVISITSQLGSFSHMFLFL